MKYYLFASKNPNFNDQIFHQVISSLYHQEFEYHYDKSTKRGYLYADDNLYDLLMDTYSLICLDCDSQITFLISFENNNLTKSALEIVLTSFPNQVNLLSDVIFYSIMKNNQEILSFLDQYFLSLDYDLTQTALVFISSGLNASLASSRLYIHRNTFAYRMNKFIEITKLDIRDYDNAMVFYLYQKYRQMK